jgi:xylitol oxidase
VKNWAGNLDYRARRLHEPTSIEQLQEIVRASTRVRPLGSRHSFNDLADTTADQLSLARLPRTVEIDTGARTVTVDGGIRYGELVVELHAAGWAIHNLASLPHISVAGGSATATHGSGDRLGNLATAVAAVELVGADGELAHAERGDDAEFDGMVVSLGALGVATSLTLDLEPAFSVQQNIYDDLPLDDFVEHFHEIASSADSVSFFTEWRGPVVDAVWLKRRVVGDRFEAPPRLFGATLATEERHPIRGISPAACTPQLGVPGPWHERLPHFRMDHTPSSGAELQTEYFVAREHLVEAVKGLDAMRDRIAALIQVSEVRTIAADLLWMSMAYRRASAAIHFTWKPDWEAVRRLLPDIEATLQPFEPRPHWGKLFTMEPAQIRARYERLPDFAALARRRDPTGKFSNDFLDRNVFRVAR